MNNQSSKSLETQTNIDIKKLSVDNIISKITQNKDNETTILT